MEYYTYNKMTCNYLPYKELSDKDRMELRNTGVPLYLYDGNTDAISAQPISIAWYQLDEYPDNVYRIKLDVSVVDSIAYVVQEDRLGFYVCHFSYQDERRKYLEYMSHKDFIGVLYKGDDSIMDASQVYEQLSVDRVPEYVYLRHKIV